MTITVNTPDGGTAAFPDDTSTDTITSAMKAKFGGPDSAPSGKSDDSTAGVIGNTAYRALNTGTLHLPDYLLAGLHKIERGTGYDPNATNLDQIRAENEDFAQKHPIWAATADVAGYTAPMLIPGYGEVSIAANATKGAEALGVARPWLAKGIGSAAEGGVLSGAGAWTSGASNEDSLKAAGMGAAIAGPLGAAVGARTPTAGAPVARSLNDLQAEEAANYAHLKTLPVNPTMVNQGVSGAARTLDASDISGMSGNFKAQLADVMKQVNSGIPLTANDMNSMARQLSNAQRDGTDKLVSTRIGDVLRGFYSQAQADARMGTARAEDMAWLTNPGMTMEQKVAQAQENIKPDSKMLMDAPTKEAMTNLANAGPGRIAQGLQNATAFGINHGIGLAGGSVIGGALGQAGIGELLGLSKGTGSLNIGKIPFNMYNKAKILRAVKAAQAASSTGQRATPDMFLSNPWVSKTARNVAVAGGLAGDY